MRGCLRRCCGEPSSPLSAARSAAEWRTVLRSGWSRWTVSLVLSASDGRVLWRGDHLTAEQAYTVVGDDRQGTDYNLDEAIASLAQRLAENIVGRLTDDF